MTPESALEYIHSTTWLGSRPGLDRIGELMRRLGNIQDEIKIIHVAGTNGKGSVSSMLEAVLREAGYKTGLFTSPYILSFNERIRINGEDITDEALCRATEKVKPHAEAMADHPTEFELITAIAFEAFAERGCDIVVLEAGMGGRLDSTNIIKTPLVSVISGISLDHTEYLGDTVGKIAFEKAGIIKRGIPVVTTGFLPSEAMSVIRDRAAQMSSQFYVSEAAEEISSSIDGSEFIYKGREYKTGLAGEYQIKNSAVVLEAVRALRDGGTEISESAVCSGLAGAKWKGRFELLSREPYFIYDGAHNPEGARAAACSFKKYFPGIKFAVVTGVLRDKNYRYIADQIAGFAGTVYTVTPDNPRALPAEEYAAVFRELGIEAVAARSVSEAVNEAKKSEYAAAVGSLYLYGEVHKCF